MLESFIRKVKKGYWTRGGVWQWDWYIHILFAKTMSFGKYPIYLGYEVPVFGDEYLDFYKEAEILERFRDFFKDSQKTKKLLIDFDEICVSANKLIVELKNQNFDSKKYIKKQEDLSLLMGSVSLVFDEIIAHGVSEISKEESVSEADIINYILKNSSETKLTESNNKLLEIYKNFQKEFEKVDFNFEELDPKIKILLVKHTENFGWISTSERGLKPWSPQSFLDQLKVLVKEKQPNKERLFIDKVSAKNKNLIDTSAKINSYDNQAADKQVELDFLFKNYLKKKMGMYYIEEITQNLIFEELIEVSKNPKKIRKYEERYNNQLRLVWPEGGSLHFYYFKDQKEFQKIQNLIKRKRSKTQEIKGTVACRGKVEGRVRIIKAYDDLKEFKKGEILVAFQTQPAYVVVMAKAAAIVTDSGGITSHAAIIAREFGIPCVVGTNNATSLLKNGDKVLVNAIDGRVTKL
ncbi:hypothetical protein A2115_00355 [Candidatus Woesebacteria bacterium GWA1_41_8]|uniref:PEP-utilising enzyme mobile domain-containing protein n=1 Tax=Candidatus Woesebacteria bacterium GWA1_41_8 TaxID=1802471 RepID=A0A1F7WH49_9BACT|nr:MAG: hypothetical protein A2115_00355 [Candidatus Woesebacteria bacterium GWA1_41_8]